MDRILNSYAIKVSPSENNKRIWYIPHFGVKNPNKPEKNLRIVFDAAAKSNGISLNDQLLVGPDLLKGLLGVLMRFRRYQFAVKGDIKDMFLRVKVRKEDQQAQRFLWRGMNRKDQPAEYVMTSLVFGCKSSPCSAIHIKNTNALEFKDTLPEAVSAIIDDSYMEDFLYSVDQEETASTLIKQVTKINSKAGFEMHEWSSNSRNVLAAVKSQCNKNIVEIKLKNVEVKSEKVLGLQWNTNTDTFTFNLGLQKISTDLFEGSRKPTKREFLKIIMSVYDPLGFMALFTARSKILMQDVWVSGIGWDTPLADPEFQIWKSWLNDLTNISTCSIPRCYLKSCSKIKRRELHVFCDASRRTYTAVAYWRHDLEDESVQVSIIASKNRVAPLKPLSIPRLELQAALLGSRLAQVIEKEHGLIVDQRVLWSDSRTVILWIKSNPRFYQTFISHRLEEICELTSPSE